MLDIYRHDLQVGNENTEDSDLDQQSEEKEDE